MLTQVHLAGYLKVISGFVFGRYPFLPPPSTGFIFISSFLLLLRTVCCRCTGCEASNPNRTLPLDLIIEQKIKPLGVPAFTGAMFGALVPCDASCGRFPIAECPLPHQATSFMPSSHFPSGLRLRSTLPLVRALFCVVRVALADLPLNRLDSNA
jgi:hypothetical protein